MTREEEIDNAVKEFREKRKTAIGRAENGGWYFPDIFREGIKWADNHPVNVWHDASKEPKIGSNIVAIDRDGQWWDIQPYNGDYDWYGLKGWKCCIRTYDIQKWAYISDLLRM